MIVWYSISPYLFLATPCAVDLKFQTFKLFNRFAPFKSPPFSFPVAGEDEGGLNGWNGLTGLNALNLYRTFAFLSCANCSRKDKSNSSFTFNFIADRFLSLAITFSIALAVTMGSPGVTWV